MKLNFTKMHGIGNDFAVFDVTTNPTAVDYIINNASRIADRRFGIGCDQIVLMERSLDKAEISVRFINSDGTESSACGNATRCVAGLFFDENLNKTEVAINTKGGVLSVTRDTTAKYSVCVELDLPTIPQLSVSAEQALLAVLEVISPNSDALKVIGFADVGNPHCVILVKKQQIITDEIIFNYGRILETLDIFPNRTNLEFVEILPNNDIFVKVWERGAGRTLACGTGACAAGFIAMTKILDVKSVNVFMEGSYSQFGSNTPIKISLSPNHDKLIMTGPYRKVFQGVCEC